MRLPIAAATKMKRKREVIRIEKTDYLKGVITAPPSKSYTIRAIIAGSLGRGLKIVNPLFSEDTRAAVSALRKLGAGIEKGRGYLKIQGFKGRPLLGGGTVGVGESGTLLRLILPLIALGKGSFTVTGRGTLLKRTNKPIAEALVSLGVDIQGKDEEYRLPIKIKADGSLPGGKVEVSGSISSQTVSALLLSGGLAKEDMEITVKDDLVSRPYVDMTLDVLARAGIKVKRRGYQRFFIPAGQRFNFKNDFVVPGDYSSAAFLIAAACLVPSDVVIKGLFKDKQGDRGIIAILNRMGAGIRHANNEVRIKGPFELKGADIDAGDTPDLAPLLTSVACLAKGRTRIYNVGHLAHKESNRLSAPAGELRKLGADIEIGQDSLIVRGGALRQGKVSSCNDHRIAMSLAVIGLRIGGVVIEGADAAAKSYPGFVRDMRGLGAKIIACRDRL